jgi:cellobiose epimerase
MEANQTTELLASYKAEMQQELSNILGYWSMYAVDEINGGFHGRINNDNEADPAAPKGSVLNSRILWSYSAAFNLTGNQEWFELATRAYNYIADHFIDKVYGGVYWTVDHKGDPLDTKKQIYALSFAVYGLSEYYKASKNNEALILAIELYRAIFEFSYDNQYGGYIEALTRDWREIEDLRLSDKDANEKKSMNTHLHVIEGFANLYTVWPDATLKSRIEELVHIFLDHIIDPDTHHLQLFFGEDWQSKYNIVSYGHDIEAAWLIQEAAEIIQHEGLLEKVKRYSLMIAEAASGGLDEDGGLWYEFNADDNHMVKEKHWWPQAEAMVGYYNTYQLTGNVQWLMRSYGSWNFVKENILNKDKGEWYWGVYPDHSIMQGQDKAGLWKCPYHNSRACIEILSRIG